MSSGLAETRTELLYSPNLPFQSNETTNRIQKVTMDNEPSPEPVSIEAQPPAPVEEPNAKFFQVRQRYRDRKQVLESELKRVNTALEALDEVLQAIEAEKAKLAPDTPTPPPIPSAVLP